MLLFANSLLLLSKTVMKIIFFFTEILRIDEHFSTVLIKFAVDFTPETTIARPINNNYVRLPDVIALALLF